MAGMLIGMCRRNKSQLAAVQLTPTTDIAIAKFEEKDRPVKVVMQATGRTWSDSVTSRPALTTNFAACPNSQQLWP